MGTFAVGSKASLLGFAASSAGRRGNESPSRSFTLAKTIEIQFTKCHSAGIFWNFVETVLGHYGQNKVTRMTYFTGAEEVPYEILVCRKESETTVVVSSD